MPLQLSKERVQFAISSVELRPTLVLVLCMCVLCSPSRLLPLTIVCGSQRQFMVGIASVCSATLVSGRISPYQRSRGKHQLPFTYLGIPLGTTKPLVKDYAPFAELRGNYLLVQFTFLIQAGCILLTQLSLRSLYTSCAPSVCLKQS